MAEEFDEDLKKLRQGKNLSALYAKSLKREYAKETELLELNLLKEFSRLLASLRVKSERKTTKGGEIEVRKLKRMLKLIINVLREPPMSAATHALVGELLKDLRTKLKAKGFHIEETLKVQNDTVRGLAVEKNNWLDQLDKHSEWMEQIPRGKGLGWKVSGTVIERTLNRIKDEQVEAAMKTEDGKKTKQALNKELMTVPSPSTIDRHRNRRLKLKK